MSKQTSSTANPELELVTEAELAARGDESALDRLFAQLGNSAWGIAFATADAVGAAADAVATGFAETLQLFDNGLPVDDVRTELLQATRTAALNATNLRNQIPAVEGAHAREPLSLLGETKDRQATLAFTALAEEMRSALWLTEAEGLSITKTSQLLNQSHKTTEDLARQARAAFRSYYVDAVKRDGRSAGCINTLDKLAAYVGRSLPAGEVAAVEHHLAEDKDCRAIVMKLDDLEGRLHAAIPAVPAWTRQQVADMWAEFVPTVAVATDREPKTEETKRRPVGALVGLLAVAVAAAVVLLGVGIFSGGSNSKVSQTAAPTTLAGAVATPTPQPTSTTIAPEPSTTVTLAPPTSVPPTTAPVVAPPTTNAPTIKKPPVRARPAPRPTPTTTPSGGSLINLPPTPIGAAG